MTKIFSFCNSEDVIFELLYYANAELSDNIGHFHNKGIEPPYIIYCNGSAWRFVDQTVMDALLSENKLRRRSGSETLYEVVRISRDDWDRLSADEQYEFASVGKGVFKGFKK